MLKNIWTSFNWLDVAVILIILRGIFIGAVRGFVIELFKILGMLFATVVTLHYYVRLGELLHRILLPVVLAEIFCYLVLWSFVVLVFKFIRDGWLLILKMEAKPGFSQWGGGILGTLRSFLICGMVFYLLSFTGNQTLTAYAENSMAGHYLADLSPKIYTSTYDGILKKLFPGEEGNAKALITIKEENKDKVPTPMDK